MSVYHHAAQDGIVDILRIATKRDLNVSDDDGMTPIHIACYRGQLEALRIMTGRGFDAVIAEATSLGATCGAGHHYIYNDGHTPIDIAGIHGRDEVVRFLDKEMARQQTLNPKETTRRRLKALTDFEKREKALHKKQALADAALSELAETGTHIADASHKAVAHTLRGHLPVVAKLKHTLRLPRGKKKHDGGSYPTYSQHIGRTCKQQHADSTRVNPGGSEICLVPTDASFVLSNDDNATDSGISSNSLSPEPPSVFERPGWGCIMFRNHYMSGTLSNLCGDSLSSGDDVGLPWQYEHYSGISEIDGVHLVDPDLQRFLEDLGLLEYLDLFTQEKITMSSLALLNESDLAHLSIPMGPRKVLLAAIQKQKALVNDTDQLIAGMHL